MKYMHTVNGRPGRFDGDQIVRLCQRTNKPVLADSRDQILKEQSKSRLFRVQRGFRVPVYGFVMFPVEEPTP